MPPHPSLAPMLAVGTMFITVTGLVAEPVRFWAASGLFESRRLRITDDRRPTANRLIALTKIIIPPMHKTSAF